MGEQRNLLIYIREMLLGGMVEEMGKGGGAAGITWGTTNKQTYAAIAETDSGLTQQLAFRDQRDC